MARKVDPNSKRSILRKKREAEQKAKELEAKLKAKEQAEKELREKLAALELAEKEKQEAKEQEDEPEPEDDPYEDEIEGSELEEETDPIIEPEPDFEEPEEETESESIISESKDDYVGDDEDLMNMLNEAITDDKNPAPIEDTEVELTEDYEADFEDDFEPEDPDSDTGEEPSEIIRESTEEGKVFAGIPPKEFAEIIVEGFDGFLQWGGPIAYKRMAFTKEDRKRLRQIAQQSRMRKKEVVFDDEDLELLEKFDEFEEYNEGVPLTKQEKKSLKIPLEVLLKSKGKDLPPGWALAYAATMVMLPRVAPLFMMQIANQYAPLNEDSKPEEDPLDENIEEAELDSE